MKRLVMMALAAFLGMSLVACDGSAEKKEETKADNSMQQIENASDTDKEKMNQDTENTKSGDEKPAEE